MNGKILICLTFTFVVFIRHLPDKNNKDTIKEKYSFETYCSNKK